MQPQVIPLDSGPIPRGCCHCGCGRRTPLARWGPEKGSSYQVGEPLRYCPNHWQRRNAYGYVIEDRGFETPCHVWQGRRTREGHAFGSYLGRVGQIHRLLYVARNGSPDRGSHLHHRCEQPECINLEHLEVVTPAEHRHIHSALTWDDIREIRRRYADGGVLQRELAVEYGLTRSGVSAITLGRVWKE